VLAPDRRFLLPAVRLTADGICTLIVKKEFILEEQEDTLSELEQELNELLDREVLGGSGEGAISYFFTQAADWWSRCYLGWRI
jgi:hypothetical protein